MKELLNWTERKKLILKHSREEGEKFLNEAKHSINALFKEIRESGASKQAIKTLMYIA
jgi:hypothetical protein